MVFWTTFIIKKVGFLVRDVCLATQNFLTVNSLVCLILSSCLQSFPPPPPPSLISLLPSVTEDRGEGLTPSRGQVQRQRCMQCIMYLRYTCMYTGMYTRYDTQNISVTHALQYIM